MMELQQAIEDGAQLVMRKYKGFGEWGQAKEVSSEVAMHKAQVRVYDEDGMGHCPYGFELA